MTPEDTPRMAERTDRQAQIDPWKAVWEIEISDETGGGFYYRAAAVDAARAADALRHQQELAQAQTTIHIMLLAAPPEDEVQNQIDVMHRRLATERLGEGGITVPQMGQLLLACSQRMAADWGRVGALERERNQLSAKLSTAEATIASLTAQVAQQGACQCGDDEVCAMRREIIALRAERDGLRTAALALRDAMTASADPQDWYPALHTLLALVQEP